MENLLKEMHGAVYIYCLLTASILSVFCFITDLVGENI